MVMYFDHDVNEITQDQFNKLNEDETYRVVHAFENEKVRLVITWQGRIEDAENMFRTTYPLFKAEQHDKVGDKWVEAPESGTTFANKRKMESFYENFVMSWTESYLDDNCEIVEVGNKLTPPEPVSEDAPQGVYDEMVW